MATSGPAPQHLPEAIIDPSEGFLGDDVPMEIGPSPDERVESVDELLLACRFRFPDDVLDFRQEVFDVLLRGGDEKLSPVLSDLLSQKNETVRDMHDAGLLLRELQSTFFQELFDEGSDVLLEELF